MAPGHHGVGQAYSLHDVREMALSRPVLLQVKKISRIARGFASILPALDEKQRDILEYFISPALPRYR